MLGEKRGQKLAIGLFLALLGFAILAIGVAQEDPLPALAQQGEGDSSPRAYLPLVARNYAPPLALTVPLQYRVGTSDAYPSSHEVAFNAAGNFQVWEGRFIQTANWNDGVVYQIYRTYLLAAIPDLGGRPVLSAGLRLLVTGGSRCTVTVHAGTWPGTGLPALPQEWQAYGDEIGAWSPDHYNPGGAGFYPAEIPIAPAAITAGQVWKGVLRSRDDLLANELCPEVGLEGGGLSAVGDCDRDNVSPIDGCFDAHLHLVAGNPGADK